MYFRDCDKRKFYYESVEVKVIESGYYTFRGRGSIDAYGSIYKNKFNPLNPLENFLDKDDDSGSDIQFKLDIHLDIGMSYVLIVTTSGSKETGEFSVFAFGKNKVTLKSLSKYIYTFVLYTE
jgi:hypothetical protein